MEKKQTAVEWLIEQINSAPEEFSDDQWFEVFAIAYDMERTNIQSAFLDGDANAYRKEETYKNETDYFNQTYGSHNHPTAD